MCSFDVKKPMFGIQSPIHMALRGTQMQKFVPENPLTPPKAVADTKRAVINWAIPDGDFKRVAMATDPTISGFRSPVGVYQSLDKGDKQKQRQGQDPLASGVRDVK
jgi:hypothetical protein